MKKIYLLLCLLMLTGCSAIGNTISSTANALSSQEKMQYDGSDSATFVLANRVVRNEQVVMVHPNVNLDNPPTALFVPFGLTQDVLQHESLSQGISRTIWQQFLSSQAFSAIELAQMSPPYRVEYALPIARQKNADFLVGGYVTYYFEGGSTADSRVSLILEVYDVKTNQLIWSVAHAGEMPYETVRDFILFKVKTAMPFDPAYVVTATLAQDMAQLLKLWTTPQASQGQTDTTGKSY